MLKFPARFYTLAAKLVFVVGDTSLTHVTAARRGDTSLTHVPAARRGDTSLTHVPATRRGGAYLTRVLRGYRIVWLFSRSVGWGRIRLLSGIWNRINL